MRLPDIPTAITDEEASELFRLSRGRRVLEIGSLLGFSTVVMAKEGFVTSVDPHEGYPEDDPKPTLRPFLENLRHWGVDERVDVHIGTDYSIVPSVRGPFQMAFIDGTGRYDDTYRMLCEVFRCVVPGGTVVVHDYELPDWPEATRAVDDFVGAIPGRSIRQVGTLAILERR